MRILHLYRPRLPGIRAQTIQVLHTCHALAQIGHEVTLIADRSGKDAELNSALGRLGLQPHPRLIIQLNPHENKTWAGFWFRRRALQWLKGKPGLVLARDKKRLNEALRFFSGRHKIILECHALDSAIAKERGESPKKWERLEGGLATKSHGLIFNCGGVEQLWIEAHGDRMPKNRVVIHNGTQNTKPIPWDPTRTVRCLGSWKSFKGVELYIALAEALDRPLEFIGATPEIIEEHKNKKIRLLPPAPYSEIPNLISSSRALLLPLQNDLFGRKLTSPLKLWDYLASEVPIIAPRLPTVLEIKEKSGAKIHLHDPDDLQDLKRALGEALKAPPRRLFIRSWIQRGAEIDAFIKRLQ